MVSLAPAEIDRDLGGAAVMPGGVDTPDTRAACASRLA